MKYLEIGATVRRLRKQHYGTTDHLSKSCGMHWHTIRAIESGKTNSSFDKIQVLAAAFGMKASEFIATVERDNEPPDIGNHITESGFSADRAARRPHPTPYPTTKTPASPNGDARKGIPESL